MFNNLILLDRHAVRRASLAIFAITLVAACDTERPTSPAAVKLAAEVPTSVNGMVTPQDVAKESPVPFPQRGLDLHVGAQDSHVVGQGTSRCPGE